jgi:hypothetical protein
MGVLSDFDPSIMAQTVPQPDGGLLAGIQPQMQAAPQPQQPEGLLQAPQPGPMDHPGFLERIRTPDEKSGLSLGDKLYMVGDAFGNGDAMQTYQKNHRADAVTAKAEATKRADSQRRNAAFKAAYVNGKFDPAAFVSALGDTSEDLGDVASLAKNLRPERPQTYSTSDGLVSVGEDNKPTLTYPVQHKLPAGLRMGEDGQPEIDPQYLALQTQLANARAGAVASHRAPPRGRAGGASTGLPPNYVPR